MKVYQTNEIKNISILGSSGSGKTTLAEAMLYEGGVIKRRGSVEAKNTVCDYFPVEKEYGYSVFSTVFSVEWQDRKLNFIDCPGSDDFIGGAVSALNVTDTALMVLNAQYGVEVGTINQFRYTEQFHKPVIFVVNQLDHEKADYDGTVAQLRDRWGGKIVPIQYPVTTGASFNAVVDVLKMKMYRWKPEGGVPDVLEIPAEEMDKAMELHKALVEAAAEHDDILMEKFFEEGTLSEDDMRAGIRAGLVTRGMFPVFCVCAGRDMCVRRTLEFLGNVVPCTDKMPRPVTTEGVEVTPPTPPDALPKQASGLMSSVWTRHGRASPPRWWRLSFGWPLTGWSMSPVTPPPWPGTWHAFPSGDMMPAPPWRWICSPERRMWRRWYACTN